MSYIKSYRGQNYILPPNLTDLFSEDHVCYLIEQITDVLDYSEFDEKYAGVGHPAYHPRIPLKLLLMSSVNGVRSSRRIAKNSQENAVYIYLSEKVRPDFRTISDFRKNNKELLKQVSLQLNKFALDKGLIDLSHISIDGTTIKANANSKKTIDKETLEKLSKYIEEQIEEGIKVDEEEDALYGDRGMHQLPKDLDDREKRKPYVQKIVEEVRKAMSERNEGKIEEIKEEVEGTIKFMEEGNQKKHNHTDSDARFMLNKKGGKELSYNAQVVVDKNGIIVHNNVVREADDRKQLLPGIDGLEENIGKLPNNTKVLADAGYEKAKAVAELDERGFNVYVPGKKSKKSEFKYDEEKDEYLSPKGEILKRTGTFFSKKRNERLTIYKGIVDEKERVIHALPQDKVLNRIKEKLRTKEGRQTYSLRQSVERSIGDIKQNRKLRAFLLRGIDNVRTEFGLACTAHNLVRINNLLIQHPP